MDVPRKIQYAAQRLKSGHRANRITVRDFLSHFGAERRGSLKVQAIRKMLDSLDLETEPDFETAWIDGPIRLRLKPGVPLEQPTAGSGEELDSGLTNVDGEEIILEGAPDAVREAEAQNEAAPTAAEPDAPESDENAESSDPTFRIGLLPEANKKLVVVGQSDPISKAITLMLQYDLSQLPVMQGNREVKGVVTWKSICAKQALGHGCNTVSECREDARIVNANRTLFDVIPTIVEHGYVLVRSQHDRRITGIVTSSDLSLQFRTIAGPFLLVREIELHVRQLLLKAELTDDDFDLLRSSDHPSRKPQNVHQLNFGECILLLQREEIWSRLGLPIDGGELIRLLNDVRGIRNEVFHFDPDPMTADELSILNRAARFLRELYELAL